MDEEAGAEAGGSGGGGGSYYIDLTDRNAHGQRPAGIKTAKKNARVLFGTRRPRTRAPRSIQPQPSGAGASRGTLGAGARFGRGSNRPQGRERAKSCHKGRFGSFCDQRDKWALRSPDGPTIGRHADVSPPRVRSEPRARLWFDWGRVWVVEARAGAYEGAELHPLYHIKSRT